MRALILHGWKILIAAVNLTRRFGDRVAVDNVSFDVRRGEILALAGPNGAGKTTTLRMLAGLIGPTSGSVSIDGIQLTSSSGGRLRARIGFLTEAPGLWDRLTVRENLSIYAGLYGIAQPAPKVDAVLETFGLSDRSSTRAAELSKGLRQKVALARAWLHAPAVLLLDEPTSGLDPAVTLEFRELLLDRRAAGCAIVVSTHNLDEAERVADRIAFVRQRLLAVDRPDALRQRLTTGRVRIRLASDASPYLGVARRFDDRASVDGATLVLVLGSAARRTPDVVRALAAAGADIVELRPEVPALEDVYLHVVSDEERWS
jgi:ABC-2 type transport system ATP-binding protein